MKTKNWNRLCISLLLLLNTGFLMSMILSETQSRILVTISFYFTVWVPCLIRKILKIKLPESMELIYLSFLFLAQFLGSVVNLYAKIYWFDSFVHFVSGILTAVLSISILYWFHKYDSKSIWFNIFFMIAFSLMIASLWEFFEFTSDSILKGDTQHVLTTGVGDTMKDMIVAFLGSILTAIYYAYEKTMERKQLFYKLEKELGGKYGGY